MTSSRSSRIDQVVDKLSALSLDVEVLASLEEAAAAVATEEVSTSRRKKQALLDKLLAGADDMSGLLKDGAERHSLTREAMQRRLAADAHERMLLEAASLTGADRNHGVVISIPVPMQFARRFPDPVVYNHGHPPHLTALYVANEMSMGDASHVLHMVRKVGRTLAPFRVFGDVNAGLKDFGDTDKGEKALWIPARADPRGELGRMHRALRSALEREGFEIESHNDYTPHITWSYVPNTISEEERRRTEARAADRFPDGFWFDVRHLQMSMPDGRVKAIALSPLPRKSIY